MRMGKRPDGGAAARSAAGKPWSFPVAPMGNRPRGPAPVTRAAKNPARGKGGSLLYLAVAGGLALAASAAVLNRHWPKFAEAPAPAVAKKPDAALKKQAGQIIIPRANSDLCDRYSFDNASGQMRPVETSPCGKRAQDVNIADQIQSFHSSWRGRGGAVAPAPEAPPAR